MVHHEGGEWERRCPLRGAQQDGESGQENWGNATDMGLKGKRKTTSIGSISARKKSAESGL